MYIYLIVKLVTIVMFIGYLLSVISYISNEVVFLICRLKYYGICAKFLFHNCMVYRASNVILIQRRHHCVF